MRSRSNGLGFSLDLQGPKAILQAVVLGGFLLLAVVLGGSSASGITANAVLQVAAVVALAATLGWSRRIAQSPGERQLLVLCGLLVLLFVVQLLPMPPALWTALPGRELVVKGLGALGQLLPWMPLTLAPDKTLQSALALLPPIAVIVMVGAFRRPVARTSVIALVAILVLSVLVGVAQVAGSNTLYLYSFTNMGSAVGFFANANHFGTLMCLTMPVVAGLVARWRGSAEGEQAVSRVVAAVVLLGVVLLALLGVTMTKSSAALVLALLSLVGSGAIVLSGLSRMVRVGFIVGVVVVLIVAGAVLFANGASDFGAAAMHNSEVGRVDFWRATVRAIAQFGALGSGFGSFPQLFHLFEDPNTVGLALANHAHNDLLEFALEGGIPGLVLLGMFLTWFVARFVSVWLIARRRDALAQGGSVGALVVLLHSLVDYPLRTAAIASLFGLCLALMARQSAGEASEGAPAEQPAGRHLSA